MNAFNRSVLCCLLLAAGCSKSDEVAPAGGAAAVDGALSESGAVKIELSPLEEPPAPPLKAWPYADLAALPAIEGGKLIAAAHCEPAGTKFTCGAKFTWQLPEQLSGGSSLWIVTLDPATRQWRWTGEQALVSYDGRSATGLVWHFSDVGLAGGSPYWNEVVVRVREVPRPDMFRSDHRFREANFGRDMGVEGVALAGAVVKITFPGGDEVFAQGVTDPNGEVRLDLGERTGKFRVHLSHPDANRGTRTEDFEKIYHMRPETIVLPLKSVTPQQQRIIFHISGRSGSGTVVNNFQPINYNESDADITPEEAESVFTKEEEYYLPKKGYQWELVAAGTDVKAANSKELLPYVVATNVPTNKQLCGGLALSPLVGGPFVMPTDLAWRIVETFGAPKDSAQPGYVVKWPKEGEAKHFALVVEIQPEVKIISKDETGLVWRGPLDKFPRDYGEYAFYYIPWDKIDVSRVGDPDPNKERVTPKHCKHHVSQFLPVPFANALITAGDEVSELIGEGGRYDWGGNLGTNLSGDLMKIPELKNPKTNSSRGVSTSSVQWMDMKAQYNKSWWLNVLRFETEELCELAMSKDVRWYGNSKLADLQPRDLGGVTTYRPRPPAPVDTSNASPLDQALAGNRTLNQAFLMWRCGRHVFLLERYLYSSNDPNPQVSAAERDREQLMAENIFGIVNRRMIEGGAIGPRRPVGFPGRR